LLRPLATHDEASGFAYDHYMPKVVIVGAGISGLATAYRLRQLLPSVEVQVLEQRQRPGGTVWTERRDGFQVEAGPNGFLDTKSSTLNLCRELSLASQLVPASDLASKNRYLFLDGKLRLLPGSPAGFLATDLLSWRAKLSVLAERWRRRRSNGPDESIADFVRRRAGREAADVLADALVTGIYAGDPALLSLRASFPNVAAMEDECGSVLKGLAASAKRRRQEAAAQGTSSGGSPRMWTLQEGLRLLMETLRDRLPEPPLLGVAVRGIALKEGGKGPGAGVGDPNLRPPIPNPWSLRGDGPERWDADAVVLACPAYQQAAIVADLDQELADRIGAIPYNRVAVVGLGYRRTDVPGDLNGFGYLAPQRTRRDLLGVQWCSSLFPGRAPPGMVLLRAMCGGWHRADVAGWDDERLLAAVRGELQAAMGITAAPVFHTIVRWERAIPQYHLGHLERVAWIEKRGRSYPGLFLTGNAYHGVALNDCTEQAIIVAGRIRDYLAEPMNAMNPGF
jgi:oxygen-dependent protoporphyrinogen oxidase